MKDALGRELQQGDQVAHVGNFGRSSVIVSVGFVESFTEYMVRVDLHEERGNRAAIVTPWRLIILEPV